MSHQWHAYGRIYEISRSTVVGGYTFKKKKGKTKEMTLKKNNRRGGGDTNTKVNNENGCVSVLD